MVTKFQIFSVLASMFHVNLCRGSWGPTGSVLNFEMMKHAFFCLNSLSRNAHLKLFWCQQRVPPRITGFKSSSKKMQQAEIVAKVKDAWEPIYFQIFPKIASMFHVNLCGGSWGPTGSVSTEF